MAEGEGTRRKTRKRERRLIERDDEKCNDIIKMWGVKRGEGEVLSVSLKVLELSDPISNSPDLGEEHLGTSKPCVFKAFLKFNGFVSGLIDK